MANLKGYKPHRDFVGVEGDPSQDNMGPEAIKSDIDQLMSMFNPEATITYQGKTYQGGISTENLNFDFSDEEMSAKIGSADIEGLTADNNVYAQLGGIVNMLLSHSNLSAASTLSKIGGYASTQDASGAVSKTESNGQSIVDALYTMIFDRYNKAVTDSLISENTNVAITKLNYNASTGVLTATTKGGTVTEVFDLNIEKIPVSIAFVEEGGVTYIRITNTDGTYTQSDITNFVTQYAFNASDEIDFTVTAGVGRNKAVTANVKENSIKKKHLDSTIISTIEGYATSASASATSANQSATNAAASEANAQSYKDSASAAATNAATSEANAKNYEATASTAASNASASEAKALTYKNAAGESADNASTSETKTLGYKNEAAASASGASASESNALAYKNAAATSATNASASEANAANSATKANTSATNAAASEASALTSKTDAATSATTATDNATLAISYAVGGTGTREGEDTDNAKYYKEQAAEIVGHDFATKTELANAIANVETHTINGKELGDNPTLDASDVGLGNVDNTADKDKPVSTATQTELDKKANATDLTSHTSDTSNPHSVTAEQVGLGKVDNTADKDKPVSTATQTALDAKVNTTDFDSYKETVTTSLDAKVAKTDFTTDGDKVKTLTIDGSAYEFSGGLMPQIIVTVSVGSSVVCTNGTWQETQIVTETGKVAFNVPSYGEYTVTATLDAELRTQTVSVTECRQYEIEIAYYVIMTAKIDLSNSNPATCVTYADDAVNMTAGSADWDDFFGHYPVLLKNGVEVGKLNPNNFAKFEDGSTADITSGNAGDVMIAFPRRGLKISKSGSIVTVTMTDNPNDANFDYNAHTRGATAKDVFYLGAYKGYTMDSKLRSLSGKTPTVSQTIGTFRTQAQANGTGYEQSAFYQLTYRQAMFILKYKTLDSQTAVGMGYVDSSHSAALASGGTESYGMDSEIIKASNPSYMTDQNHHVKCFGIEDFWGNIYEWIDGLFCNSSYHILTGSDGFNDTGSGYTDNGAYTSSGIWGYMTNVTGDSNTGFNITTGGGSSSTYFADYAYLYAGSLPRFGGNWSVGAYAGAFYLDVYCSASNASSFLGARLMFL